MGMEGGGGVRRERNKGKKGTISPIVLLCAVDGLDKVREKLSTRKMSSSSLDCLVFVAYCVCFFFLSPLSLKKTGADISYYSPYSNSNNNLIKNQN